MDINENINIIIQSAIGRGCRVLEHEPMSKYTTFKIGGEARAIIFVGNLKTMSDLVRVCTDENVPYFILGNGSNLLVSDDGYNGIMFKLEGDFKKISLLEENTVFCGAGVSLAKLCKFALDHNLSGLEFAWGIPGSVGGAAYMNAGAYGGEMKDVLMSASYIDPQGSQGRFTVDEMNLSYRHSVFTDNGYIISGVILVLKEDSHDSIRERMDDFMDRRRSKQPLEFPSAGSVFKRPEGYFAGGLIEQCNLKGEQIGGAQVSIKHAGFIVNKGGATCDDVCKLVKHIQDTVLEKTGVELECEINRL
ncbi:MAG: UDP-N-acetylmuramate dehydrogenase [Lachnospiraceae bacterium]|nr:UDP-N-acetylmuramate dehydrogenase [Lachnospiraceae bacterium]